MRQAGTVPNAELAQRLADYLLTQQIETRIDAPEGDGVGWAVWIRDDEQVDAGKSVLAEFLANPEDARFVDAGREAARLRKEQQRQARRAAERQINVRQRWQVATGIPPLTAVLIIASCAVALLTQFGSRLEPVRSALSIVEIRKSNVPGMIEWNRSLVNELRTGQVWRLVTPMLIHFGILHLLFNMYWLFRFGRDIEIRAGSLRFAVLVLAISVSSNVAQFLATANPLFGGMSGVVYGLFGFLWIKSRFDPRSGYFVDQITSILLIAWFFICAFGWVGPIANWAHGVGLVAGAALAYAPVAWRRVAG